MNAPAELALNRPSPSRDAVLWLGAGMTMLAAHAAFAYLLRDLGPLAPQQDAMEQAMVVELEPLPISVPETVQSEILPQDEPVEKVQPVEEPTDTVQPEPEQVTQAEPEVVEEIKPEPEDEQPVTETAEPVEEAVEPEIPEQDIVEAITPEVAIPLPEPKPEVPLEKKAEPRRKPVRKKPEVVREKVKKAVEPERRQAADDTGKSKKQPVASQASRASKAPDPSRWNSAVRAAIARRAGSVRGMRGTVRVSFAVSSSGSIVSASVTGSSGDDRLDRAALSMVRGARVPAPPAGLGGSRHSFAIPLTFR